MIRDMLMEAPWDTLQSFDFGKVTSLTAIVTRGGRRQARCRIEQPGRIRIAAVRAR